MQQYLDQLEDPADEAEEEEDVTTQMQVTSVTEEDEAASTDKVHTYKISVLKLLCKDHTCLSICDM